MYQVKYIQFIRNLQEMWFIRNLQLRNLLRVYKELTGNVEGTLEKIIKTVLKKVRDRRDISDNTLDYFLVNNPK